MDYQHHYQQYGQPEPHPPHPPQPPFDQPYDPYYAAYPQAAPPYDPSAAYNPPYYDYSGYAQPPPPGIESAHLHYAAASNEYGQMTDFAGSSQGIGDPSQTGFRGAFRGGRGNFGTRRGGRGNFGNSRGRGGGNRQLSRGTRPKPLAQHPQPPAVPKPPKQPKPHAWCDVCRVDCNSPEILEQHRAGKKHKKTVQRLEEYEKMKQISQSQYQPTEVPVPVPAQVPVPVPVPEPLLQPKPELIPVQEPVVQVVSEASLPITTQEQNVEAKEEESKPKPEPVPVISDSKRPREDGFGLGFAYGHGSRYNNRGGRTNTRGKRPKRFGEFNPVPAPVQRVRPVVCTLCSVNCDTPAVFEAHLLGKKHLGRVRKFQGPNSVFGPITVYIPPNQPVVGQSVGPEPIFYGLTTVELIQQHEMVMRDDDEEGLEGKKDLGEGDVKEEELVGGSVGDGNQNEGGEEGNGDSNEVEITGVDGEVEIRGV